MPIAGLFLGETARLGLLDGVAIGHEAQEALGAVAGVRQRSGGESAHGLAAADSDEGVLGIRGVEVGVAAAVPGAVERGVGRVLGNAKEVGAGGSGAEVAGWDVDGVVGGEEAPASRRELGEFCHGDHR